MAFLWGAKCEKLEILNRRILRFTLDDFVSTYNILLDEVNCVLNNRRVQNMLILLYKSLFLTKAPFTPKQCLKAV